MSKTDKRLLAALVVAGYEERTARDLIQKHVYTLTQADLRHLVSEISNGVGQSQAYDAIYQARRIRLARTAPGDGHSLSVSGCREQTSPSGRVSRF